MTKRMKRIAALLTCGLVLASGTSVYAGNAEGTLLGYPISLEVSVRKLSLSEELLKEDFVLNGMLFKNEEGLGFEYTQYLDMDQINWYGYISWEDLLSDENNVKVLIEPRMTSRGYPLDEDGNVIGAQE